MAYQYPLNGGRINASIGGNSTSAGAGYSLVSTGTLLLAGGNNITLSQNGSAVTISGGNGVALYDGVNSISSGTARVSAAGGLTASINGQTLSLSAPAQSSLSATGIFSISANGSTISMGAPAYSAGISTNGNTSGTTGFATNQLLLAGGNNITLSQSTGVGGNTLTISAANQSNQSLGYYATGNTTGQSSSSTFDARSVSVSAAGGISAGFSGSALQLSAPAQSSLSGTGIISISRNADTISIGAPAFSVGISTNGNTSGTSGTASNQVIFAGGNNITLSQATGAGGNTISISAPNIPSGSINFSAGTTSNNLAALTLSNSNGVSFGLNGSTITASHNGLTSQSNQALSASNGSFAFQTAAFSNANGVTFGTSAGSIMTASVNTSYAASNHSHGNPTLNLTNLSGTTASASNGLTLSLSAAAQSAQSVGLYALGNTTQSSSTTLDARSLSFNGLGGVSVGYSNGSIQISGGAGGGGGGVALYDGVNSISSGTARVSAGGALTASVNGQTLSLNAPATSSLSATGAVSISTNGSTISIGAPSQTNQTLGISATSNTFSSSNGTVDARSLYLRGVGAASVGISNGSVLISAPNAAAGNVTFSAGTSSGGYASLVFSNSNGVSFGLNGSTITASAVGGGGGGVALYDGTNSISSGTAQISATGALTASINGQTLNLSVPVVSSLSATGAVSISNNAGTISIGAPLITSPRWEYPNQVFTTIGAPVSNSLSMQHVFIPFNVSARSARLAASFNVSSLTTTGSGTVNLSLNLGLYTLNGSTLSLLTSGSTLNSYQITASGAAGVSSVLNGVREISAPLSANVTPGDYWVGALLATAQTGSGMAITMMGNNQLASASGSIGVLGSSISAAARDVLMGQGLYATAALPSSVAISAINNTSASNLARAAFYHAMYSTVF